MFQVMSLQEWIVAAVEKKQEQYAYECLRERLSVLCALINSCLDEPDISSVNAVSLHKEFDRYGKEFARITTIMQTMHDSTGVV